ncbi:MAG: hypothetical protein ABR956_05290 [Terracidiphilus sp.]|jgi:hypothetical protein
MNRVQILSALALAAFACGAQAQQSSYERFRAHNAAMTALQPAIVTPLVEADPRLIQYLRASFSNGYTAAGTQTTSYGNGRGAGVIAGNRFEFDYLPPSYTQHNSATEKDGFGDTSTVVKARIASGNAEHGNFDVAATVSHSFATGSNKNGALTDAWAPTLAGCYAFRQFNAQSSLGGTMPTGKIAAQGRTIAWNALAQAHLSRHVWLEVENNASFYFEGSHNGKMQNFITPAAFLVVRRKQWEPAHAYVIFDSGMQIATSGFHTCNHNLISEMRILF